MTADLATWLRAQLDADEEVARLANAIDPAPWYEDVDYDSYTNQRQGIHGAGLVYAADNVALWDREQSCTLSMTAPTAVHVTLHDPAWALADIASKRALIDAWLPPGENPHPDHPCTSDPDGDPDGEDFNTPWNRGACVWHLDAMKRRYPGDLVLRHLATAYAARPGYDESWRP